MGTFLILLFTFVGYLVLPLWILGFTILFIKQISDDPQNPEKPYFFTAIEPGRIKAVLRGGKLVRYMMNYAGNRFSREGADKTEDKYWNVEPGDEPAKITTHEPFSFWKYFFWPFNIRKVFSWYNSVVQRVTGHVFVGIWPFQTLYIYKFTRKVQKKDSLGRPMINDDGLPILEDNQESTDHVRGRVFVWHVEGQAGETKEGLKVEVRGMALVYTRNPQKALFGADRWDVVLSSTILRALASNIRTMSISSVLTSENASTKDELALKVTTEANVSLATYGLEVAEYQIIDFEARLSPEEASALTAKWRAEREREAEAIRGLGRGQGRAAEITAVANAIKSGGEEAKRAQELEALIRQAAEAGKSGGVVILNSGNSSDGLLAGILAETKKRSR